MISNRHSNAIVRTLALACITAVCILLSPPSGQAMEVQRKQILLLNSYHHNFIWTEEIFQGLTDVLRPKETGIDLHVENMDTKRVEFNEHYIQQLRSVYEHKFKDLKFDLVMATDNNAFDFVRRYHDELFPGIPVVFCGVNAFHDDLIKDLPLFSGVAENVDAKGTLWWALNQHPQTETIYIINDHTPTGQAITSTISNELAEFPPEISIRYSDNIDLQELLKEVRSLPGKSLILYGLYFRDKNGRFYDTSEVLKAVRNETKIPIYGVLDFDLGNGIVGGMLSSGHFQGQTMAQIALHVLAGRSPGDIPVITEGVSLPMFDYEQLKEHRIRIDSLPDNSKIINRPSSIYSENAEIIWTGVAFTIIQMIIILVLVFNTTRRRQAEKELRSAHQMLEERVRERTSEVKESEEALRTVFDASHDAIFIHNASGAILDANERMLKMYNLSRDDLGDLSIARDISSRNNAVYRLSSLWRSVINGDPQYFEWKARRPHDGTEFDVEVYLNRIAFRGQEAILANVRDITVRKESENRIRQSLSKFEAILENSLMGIAMSRGRVFATINRRGAEIFGYNPDELIGSELSFLLSDPDAVEDFVENSKISLLERGEFNTEQAFRNKQGGTVWCRMYAKAIDQDSLDKGVIWAWDDITDHRRDQEDLVRTREAAEAANRAKSEFLAAMSHEIRTPMNAIVGMTDILLQTTLEEEQRDYLKTVMDSARHLISIINDILDLAKIEAKKLVLDRIDFDLPFHVETTVKGLELQGKQKGLDVVLEISEDVPRCVKGDPLSLRQVIMNLVGNAIKFTHKGSIVIRLRSALQDPHRDPSDPRNIGISIEVEDTGIGIPEEFIDTIFQSFSQNTRAFGGTGLGLSICKELLALMDGDICVESQVGKGSTFRFTAWLEPGHSCPTRTDDLSNHVEPLDRPLHVLVAEDNDVNVMVTTLRLEDMGYTFSVAGNGLEVLDLLKREPFDLILMDIEMPVLDGISATRAIRSSTPGGDIPDPDIPIIGVTAHALKEFREKSLDAGMNDYVSKPVDFNELSIIINRLMANAPDKTFNIVTAAPTIESAEDQAQPEPATAQDPPAQDELPLWSPDKAMDDLGIDETMFKDFVATARDEMERRLGTLQGAFEDNDISEAATQANIIKSICLTIGAHVAALSAAEVENQCLLDTPTAHAITDLTNEAQRLLKLIDGT